MSSSRKDSSVGYKRPPRDTRWKQGQSGNPHRRYPKRTIGAVEMMDRFLLRPIDIVENGKTRRVSTLEAIVIYLWRQELSGHRKPARVRLKYQEFANRNIERGVQPTFADSDYTRALSAGRPKRSGGDE